MHPVIKFKTIEMIPLVSEILSQDGSVWITVTGSSMYPFLRGGKDQVQLVSCNFDTVKVGDIVLIKRKDIEQYVLHRIYKKDRSCFYIIGDSQQWIEGPLEPQQLIASVVLIKRNNRVIKCSNLFYRFLVLIWFKAIPFRYKILNGHSRYKNYIRKNIIKRP